jgi:hypothetical protein
MVRRIPLGERPELIRDPAGWARDWGWISPKKAANDASALRQLAQVMRGSMDGDEGVEVWARECERIARRLDPAPKVAALKRRMERV